MWQIAGRKASFRPLLVAMMLIVESQVSADPNVAWEWPDAGAASAGTGVWDLVVWDGDGIESLYVGGSLLNFPGGTSYANIARWDGQKWFELGGGVDGAITRMFPFDDGSGSALFVGGGINSAGGKPVQNIAMYRNGVWSALGQGLNTVPWAMLGFDDGTGPSLYVGGAFWYAGGKQVNHVARWDGEDWHGLGLGTSDGVKALAIFDDGVSGPALFAGGAFYGAEGKLVNFIAKWDGKAWSGLAGGVTGGDVTALQTFDDGSGAKLFVGGTFTKAGAVPANGLATWDGKQWAPADAGIPTAYPANVTEFTVFDGGSGPVLYAISGIVRRWTGESWEALDMSGVTGGPILAIAGFKDASGARLHIAGELIVAKEAWKNIARQTKTIGGGTPCGDLTGDGFVDQQDLGLLLGDFGCTKGVGLCPGDCDNDGDTDQADLGILLSNWEKPCP